VSPLPHERGNVGLPPDRWIVDPLRRRRTEQAAKAWDDLQTMGIGGGEPGIGL
jgi:hypothetical protein